MHDSHGNGTLDVYIEHRRESIYEMRASIDSRGERKRVRHCCESVIELVKIYWSEIVSAGLRVATFHERSESSVRRPPQEFKSSKL